MDLIRRRCIWLKRLYFTLEVSTSVPCFILQNALQHQILNKGVQSKGIFPAWKFSRHYDLLNMMYMKPFELKLPQGINSMLFLHLMCYKYRNIKQCGDSKQSNPSSDAIHHIICNTTLACHLFVQKHLSHIIAPSNAH